MTQEKSNHRMEVFSLLYQAKAQGNAMLDEVRSKRILSLYGIPVVPEALAKTRIEAAALAGAYGYPVALKGVVAGLNHKTEQGLVHLNLKNQEDVLTAVNAVDEAAGKAPEGYLVQPMMLGRREYIAGMFCDPLFGPVVLFGLGGVFTEALGDVAIRIAPVTQAQAEAMLDELSSSRLLKRFRGEQPADRDALIKTILGLSALAMDCPEVTEVDINPLIVGRDGAVAAVDALIALGKRPKEKKVASPDIGRQLKKFFYPGSVAFVGASKRVGKWGNLLFSYAMEGGFTKKVYLVNRDGGTIAERKVYKSVLDIQGNVDLAVVTVPASQVSSLLPDFERKGIRHVLLISSGFSDAGADGRELERKLVAEARQAGMLIIGPNTMGLCNPHAKFYCAGSPTWPKPGPVTLISQSGNLGTQILAFAENENIGIRAFCGSGNEAMITIEDYLDAMACDETTRTVVLYLESVKAGRRFMEQAAQVSRKKPVIVLKGGRTSAGSRAAASHTGAMAADTKVFESACRQSGIIPVHHPTDLLDLAAAFSSVPLPRDNRIAIVTIGGGWGIIAADLCVESGLAIPRMEQDLIDRVSRVLPPYWNHDNPVDLVGQFDPLLAMNVIKEVVQWDGCDAVIHLGIIGRRAYVENSLRAGLNANPGVAEKIEHRALSYFFKSEQDILDKTARLMALHGKPVVGVTLMSDGMKTVFDVPDCPYKCLSFPTPERAVAVLAQMVRYRRWLQAEGVDS